MMVMQALGMMPWPQPMAKIENPPKDEVGRVGLPYGLLDYILRTELGLPATKLNGGPGVMGNDIVEAFK